MVATAAMRFIGVFGEDWDNSAGVAGTIVNGAPLSGYQSFVKLQRKGEFRFNQSGITQAAVGQPAFFSDDNTIALTGLIYAGVITTIDEDAGLAWVDIETAVVPIQAPGRLTVTNETTSFTASAHNSANYLLAGVGATPVTLTLGAPTTGVDDGTIIRVINNSTHVNVISASGLFIVGNGTATGTATALAFPGASIQLVAVSAKWVVLSNTGFTMS